MNGRGRRGLGDYPQNPNYRVGNDPYGTAGVKGPVAAPTEVSQETQDNLFSLMQILQRLPTEIWYAGRRQLFLSQQPRDGRPFITSLGDTSIAAGATSTIATFTAPENYAGAMERIELFCYQPGGYANLTWSLQIDGVPYKGFVNFPANDAHRDFDLILPISSKSTIQLQATNGGGVALDVHGVISGWTEFLSAEKGFDKLSGLSA